MAALRRGTAPQATPPATSSSPLVKLARVCGTLWHDVLEFALPQRCPGCGAPAENARVLCERCWARLPALTTPVCARCLFDERTPDGCTRHPHDRVHAAWIYDERVAALVQAFKFGSRPALAPVLAPAMAAALARAPRPTVVTGVPLHAARRRERGYDQAACLAAALARELGVPYAEGVLVRARATVAQSGLGPEARRRNLRAAFRLAEPRWVAGHDVLVVDDVLTTGATLLEAMATVRSAGPGTRTRAAVVGWAS
ncbi:MAG: double zinc ribbon domain-containing protein [Candidatus Eisenbacteria bacterium]|nr:double zinc ribbon domain-containing protein [Candidatus Eisenbacteria bacterium]